MDLKYQPVFDPMSLTLKDIINWKLTWYEMMQGFSEIQQSRLEYDKGSFTYDISRQGRGGESADFRFFWQGGEEGLGISVQ